MNLNIKALAEIDSKIAELPEQLEHLRQAHDLGFQHHTFLSADGIGGAISYFVMRVT